MKLDFDLSWSIVLCTMSKSHMLQKISRAYIYSCYLFIFVFFSFCKFPADLGKLHFLCSDISAAQSCIQNSIKHLTLATESCIQTLNFKKSLLNKVVAIRPGLLSSPFHFSKWDDKYNIQLSVSKDKNRWKFIYLFDLLIILTDQTKFWKNVKEKAFLNVSLCFFDFLPTHFVINATLCKNCRILE